MKKLTAFVLVALVAGTVLYIGAVPTIPPLPSPTPSPEPTPGGSVPSSEQQKFKVISIEPVMEGFAGSAIKFNLRVIQKGYPALLVQLEASMPDRWKAIFSKNDFDLESDEKVDLVLSLFPPESVSAESHEIRIEAVGKAKEDTLEVKDSVTVAVVTYVVDVGIMNLQFMPVQPHPGENVTITVTAVNYTQREIANVKVEFLMNNGLVSRQTVDLLPGASLPVSFGWIGQPGSFTFVIKALADGDFNHRNDSVSFKMTLGGHESADALYEQALAFYVNEDYVLAQSLFGIAAARYTEQGETGKALEASQLQELCSYYVQAQALMAQGEQAVKMKDYEEAAQYFEQARDIYARIGDAERENVAQDRMDEVLAMLRGWASWRIYVGILVCLIVLVVVGVKMIKGRRR